MVPVQVRDGLYRLFCLGLENPSVSSSFDWVLACAQSEGPLRVAQALRGALEQSGLFAAAGTESLAVKEGLSAFRPYLRDRAPRYRRVLASVPEVAALGERERALAIGELLFNQGLYFDCHEFLEGRWRKEREPWRTCLQGIIQIAAAFHKLELEPDARGGAAELLEKGLARLSRSRDLLGAETVSGIEQALREPLEAVRSGGLRSSRAPRLSWAGRSKA